MNRNKIIMLSVGGVAFLAVIGLGAMTYLGWESKTELESDLESAKNNVERINRAAIVPEQKSVDAIKANAKALREWREAAYMLVSQGDRVEDPSITPEAFKQTMVEDARALSALPGVGDSRIVPEEFDFGFKSYIIDGAMPAKEGLPVLERQWREVVAFIKALSAAEVNALVSVVVEPASVAKVEEPEQPRTKKPPRGKKVEKKPDPTVVQGYSLTFLARPASFVRFLNALALDERFTVVEDFTITRQDDSIASVLGVSKADPAAGGRRSGRRSRRSEEVQPDADDGAPGKKGLVVDPMREPPFTVTMKIVTYDFGSKAGEAEKKEVEE
ncbi:MAG: Amuc_1100 family pilus-like protein [Kiritimatiellae bacterium]|nr:Amuc_1100 family pilus-like protein [Kiritimatiellia bacterium]